MYNYTVCNQLRTLDELNKDPSVHQSTVHQTRFVCNYRLMFIDGGFDSLPKYCRVNVDRILNLHPCFPRAWVQKHQDCRRRSAPRQIFGPFPAIINECSSWCKVCFDLKCRVPTVPTVSIFTWPTTEGTNQGKRFEDFDIKVQT